MVLSPKVAISAGEKRIQSWLSGGEVEVVKCASVPWAVDSVLSPCQYDYLRSSVTIVNWLGTQNLRFLGTGVRRKLPSNRFDSNKHLSSIYIYYRSGR